MSLILVGMKHIVELLRQHRFRVLLLTFVVMAAVLGFMIVPIESVSGTANIRSLSDGLWWSITTMTGVGFGDVYPVTTWGRVLGAVLEVLGVVVFGLIVGHIAVVLFRIRDDFYWKRLFQRLDDIEERVMRLESGQKFMVRDEKSGTSD